jgi:hypothetical protein
MLHEKFNGERFLFLPYPRPMMSPISSIISPAVSFVLSPAPDARSFMLSPNPSLNFQYYLTSQWDQFSLISILCHPKKRQRNLPFCQEIFKNSTTFSKYSEISLKADSIQP